MCMSGCTNYFSLFLKSHFPPSFKCDGKNLKTTDGLGDINLLVFFIVKQDSYRTSSHKFYRAAGVETVHTRDKNGRCQGWAGVIQSCKTMSLPHWGQDDHAGSELEKRPRLVSCSTWLWYKRVKSRKVSAIPWNNREFSAIPWMG